MPSSTKSLLALALFLASPLLVANGSNAAATLSLCNRNADRAIFGAIMRQVGGGAGWQSVGWYKVDAGKCFDISLGDYAGKAYVYAEDERHQTSWGEGNVSFCVDKVGAFAIANADTTACTAANLKKVRSDEVVIQGGVNVWEAKPNFAQLSLCNKNTTFPLYAAIATKDGGSWHARGWYEVAANACRDVPLGKYSGTFYYYGLALGGQLEWGTGPFQFCVNKTAAFSTPAAEQAVSCTGAGQAMVKAAEATAVIGMNTVTFNAVDLKTSLKICNDTAHTLFAAYALTGAVAGQWRSTGWLSLATKECRELNLGSYTGSAFVYAERNGGDYYWGPGPVNICVNKTQPFTIEDATNREKCSQDISQKMVPTYELKLTPGSFVYTLSP